METSSRAQLSWRAVQQGAAVVTQLMQELTLTANIVESHVFEAVHAGA